MKGYIVGSFYPDARKRYCQSIGIIEFTDNHVILWWAENIVKELVQHTSSTLMQRLLVTLPEKLTEALRTQSKCELEQISHVLGETLATSNLGFSNFQSIDKPLDNEQLKNIYERFTVTEPQPLFTNIKEIDLVSA